MPQINSKYAAASLKYGITAKHLTYHEVLFCRDVYVAAAVVDSLATFRSEYEYDYEYEFSVLSTRCRFKGRNFSKCACSELKTRTPSRPRTPI